MARLAFDTGGTFTDFALIDDDGILHLHKVLSTPANPARCRCSGRRRTPGAAGRAACPRTTLQILGATTVVTNAVLERKGVETAFITTDGFQDMLRIRTEGRYDLYDLRIAYPEPLVPRDCCFGVVERIARGRRVITPLDEEQRRAIAARVAGARASARSPCACCTPTSIPQHEQRIGALLAEAHPEFRSRCRPMSAPRCANTIAPRRRSSTPTRGR